MRHHFTKSERLALEMATDPWIEFSDMESGRIRRGPWQTIVSGFQRKRNVRRVVTFTITDSRFPQHKGMKVSLDGVESETDGTRETSWRVFRIMIGYQNYDEPITWKTLRIPTPEEQKGWPIHHRFPHFLMELQKPVVSADA